MRKDRIDLTGAGILLVFSAVIGLNQTLIKLVNAGYAPAFQAGARSLIAFFPILIFALVMKRRLSVSDGSFLPGIFCGLLFSAEFLLLFQALDYTTASRAAVLFNTMPIWVAAGAHFLLPGERLSGAKALGLALAIGGVALALLRSGENAGDMALIGDIMCLLGAMFWASLALTTRATKLSRSTAEMQMLYQLAVSAPVMLGFAFIHGETLREPTLLINGIFIAQALIIVCGAYLTWFWLLKIYPASSVASFSFLTPLFGVAAGWLIFDDPITWRLILALVLVGLGIILVNRRPARP